MIDFMHGFRELRHGVPVEAKPVCMLVITSFFVLCTLYLVTIVQFVRTVYPKGQGS